MLFATFSVIFKHSDSVDESTKHLVVVWVENGDWSYEQNDFLMENGLGGFDDAKMESAIRIGFQIGYKSLIVL